jgi:hypothetical protein
MAELTDAARAAWRAHRNACNLAAKRAAAVAAAWDTYQQAPCPVAKREVEDARDRYDQAEHEVARAALAAERKTGADNLDPRWGALRAARDAGRAALAAAPADAPAAAEQARAAADAVRTLELPRGPLGTVLRRPQAAAAEYAELGARRAERRAAGPSLGAVAPPPDARTELAALLAQAQDQAEACTRTVKEAAALVRRAGEALGCTSVTEGVTPEPGKTDGGA